MGAVNVVAVAKWVGHHDVGPYPGLSSGSSPGATDERQRKMVYTKRKTTGGPTCCFAA